MALQLNLLQQQRSRTSLDSFSSKAFQVKSIGLKHEQDKAARKMKWSSYIQGQGRLFLVRTSKARPLFCQKKGPLGIVVSRSLRLDKMGLNELAARYWRRALGIGHSRERTFNIKPR